SGGGFGNAVGAAGPGAAAKAGAGGGARSGGFGNAVGAAGPGAAAKAGAGGGARSGGFRRIIGAVGLSPAGLAALALGLAVVGTIDDEYYIRLLTTALMYGVLAMAFDFTSGYINIVNFGFAAFWGLGAYVTGCLAWHLGWSPWQGLLPAVGAAAALGLLLGLLTIRLGGIFAACMTWFVAMAMLSVASNWVGMTRGATGLTIPLLFRSEANLPYLIAVVIIAVFSYFVLSRIIRSKAGLAFQAIGQDIEAAAISGINANYYKIMNFTISCAFAGFLGWFFAHYVGVLTPQTLHTRATVEIMVISYIGGRGSLWGGLAAALLIIPAMEQIKSIQALSDMMELRLVLYGVLMIVVMIYYPGGLSGLVKALAQKFGLAGWVSAEKR
ncbi:MAG: branched-chain amino acid ABC transporter permease, partial [Candidatus Adiutrix sp.]|nr:branched-chain amino acid ABC transporter permease [Candidatus Adiutrix sp.]